MLAVGIVGWRGMVGSVLMSRMESENDFSRLEAVFFSTSQAGHQGPQGNILKDAYHLPALAEMDVIVSCQGGSYTGQVHPQLRAMGWRGYWIDAASTLRMESSAVIALDPVNRSLIDAALDGGCRDFVGGNCTVSLLLMALAGLLKANVVEWISSMTYQAASGGGARHMRELLTQMEQLGRLALPGSGVADDILALDTAVADEARNSLDTTCFGVPLAASAIPWIDTEVSPGQSREEWKAEVEGNKILGRSGLDMIPIDGLCVRVGSMRSHAQALTIKLNREISPLEIEDLLRQSHEWVSVVPNSPESSKQKLTPLTVSGQLDVAIGRIRQMSMGKDIISAFTVGDQLLWGAAEPLRRALNIIVDNKP